MTLQTGLSAEFEFVVGEEDTAAVLGSGDLAVLGTPRVVALFEQATVLAVADQLSAGQTTVGVEVMVRHRRPSLPGSRLTVSAQLVELDESQLSFTATASGDGKVLADATVRRVIVDRDKFLTRAGKPS